MIDLAYCDISKIDFNNINVNDFPQARIERIKEITDEKRKKQSIAVFALLTKLLKLNGLERVVKRLTADGFVWKDSFGEYFFSLSHSKNVVCAVISDSPVGIDVQAVDKKILAIKRRFMNTYGLIFDKNERAETVLTALWTAEEAVFKSGKDDIPVKYEKLNVNGEEYVLSVATEKDSAEIKERII